MASESVDQAELALKQTFCPISLAMLKNPKIRPSDLDLEILWVSRGCQGTCSCKISSS